MSRIATLIPAMGVIACSRRAAKSQRQLRPRRATAVVYPGADLAHFAARNPGQRDLRESLGLGSTGYLIGCVGRLQRWKGMHLLIQAMPAILSEHASTKCVIVGGLHSLEPDYPDYLQDLVAELGLQSHVAMVGYQADVAPWVRAMDVFVHAAENEPFGIVVIEAMASGKPVVASDSGGPAEIITDGIDGKLFKTNDTRSLAAAVTSCLDDPAAMASIAQNGRRRAESFSTGMYANNFCCALRQLVRTDGSR